MSRPTARALARFAATAVVASALAACSKTLTATYPGNHPVAYPWRACGEECDRAFVELQDTRDPTGKACEDLVVHAEHVGGADERASAAALYDSALVLILRGKSDEAGQRFARAAALDPDPEYRHLERLYLDSAASYLTAGTAPSPPAEAPTTVSTSAPAAAPPPASSPPPAPAPAPTPQR